jgi:hypothetical protein
MLVVCMSRMSFYISLTFIFVMLVVASVIFLSIMKVFDLSLGMTDNLYVVLFVFSLILIAITFQEKTFVGIMLVVYAFFILVGALLMGVKEGVLVGSVVVMIASFVTIASIAR